MVLTYGRKPERISKTLRWSIKNAKRRKGVLKDDVPYTLAEIAKRDEYRCALCGEDVDMTLTGLDKWGPTIDHVLPLVVSKDDRRSNVQLAHRDCNLRKGAAVLYAT